MSRTLLILTLLVGVLVACSPVRPLPNVPEVAQIPAAAPDNGPAAVETVPAESPTVPPAAVSDLKLTILDDNTIADETLQTDWGFAMLVEYGDHTLLFDTGTGLGSALQDNLQKLVVAPESIEAIVLSKSFLAFSPLVR